MTKDALIRPVFIFSGKVSEQWLSSDGVQVIKLEENDSEFTLESCYGRAPQIGDYVMISGQGEKVMTAMVMSETDFSFLIIMVAMGLEVDSLHRKISQVRHQYGIMDKPEEAQPA